MEKAGICGIDLCSIFPNNSACVMFLNVEVPWPKCWAYNPCCQLSLSHLLVIVHCIGGLSTFLGKKTFPMSFRGRLEVQWNNWKVLDLVFFLSNACDKVSNMMIYQNGETDRILANCLQLLAEPGASGSQGLGYSSKASAVWHRLFIGEVICSA